MDNREIFNNDLLVRSRVKKGEEKASWERCIATATNTYDDISVTAAKKVEAAAVAKLNWELANFLLKKANMNKFLAFGRKVVDENV